MKYQKIALGLMAAGLMLPGIASATNGYFSHGYGMKAKGMAGAATAVTGDTFGGANNPATMVWAGDRLDIGVDWFRPIRNAERSGATQAPGMMDLNGKSESGSKDFAIPEFGYNKMLNDRLSLGVTVYGNGGMNTDYDNMNYTCNNGVTSYKGNMLCGTTKLGIDLTQLVIAPTLSYKINENNSIGVSPLIAYQMFEAQGLQMFQGMSQSPNNVTNTGYDHAWGYGVRVGYYGRLTDKVSIGAAYASKVDMQSFDKYKGLFAESGDFDMPENYNLGLAIQATPKLLFALDYQRINYSGVNAVGNPSTNNALLGAGNGKGFGYSDVEVWKLGAEYAYSDRLTLRAGYSHTDNPISSRDVTFNIIAPAVIEDHATLGFTYAVDKQSEVTMAYMHAFQHDVSGSSFMNGMMPPGMTAGNEKIQMYQDSLGIAYGRKF